MFFPDYIKTKRIYHVVSIIDLDKVLKHGIKFDDKNTYKSKYYRFHDYIDKYRTEKIPPWVIRKRAIFGSLNFAQNHMFHSHTALLSVKIDPENCWIANENLANEIYEPFILQNLRKYVDAKKYMENEGSRMANKYWEMSCSFRENLRTRLDKEEGYDAEVLIFNHIKPSDIEVLYIKSDHKMLKEEEWKRHFCKRH